MNSGGGSDVGGVGGGAGGLTGVNSSGSVSPQEHVKAVADAAAAAQAHLNGTSEYISYPIFK